MTLGLVLTAFGLGLRHGVDWDHIAAIADLSSTARSRRQGLVLSTLYALGHAAVIVVLGLLAIVFGAALPEGLDVWMGRVVGVTLVVLGGWVLIELIRKGRDFRLRSRWMLVLGGTFAGFRRVRHATGRRRLSIEHSHEHSHDDAIPETAPEAHDHSHLAESEPVDPAAVDAPIFDEAPVGGYRRGWRSRSGGRHGPGASGPARRHSHPHRHELALAEAGTGNGTAAGIGLLHGIGFESPTQIAVFVASTSVAGVLAGISLLLAWVLGLIVANSGLAVLAGLGLLGTERNFTLYAAVAVLVGVSSLVMGTLLIVGLDVLPAI